MRPEDPPYRWWRIDPNSGKRSESAGDEDAHSAFYVGDAPLEEAAIAASNIDATFGSARHFTDAEIRLLITDRVIPESVRRHQEAATELGQSVHELWMSVDQCYQEKFGRPANAVEKRFIGEYAFDVIRGNPPQDELKNRV